MRSLVKLGKRLFGQGDKVLEPLRPIMARINELEAEFVNLPDAELQARTGNFKRRLEDGSELDEFLPEAFANCREALRRTLGLRAFDVQLLGGIVLHQGNIAEMATGEGKTLVAVFAAYLNALAAKGVHVATMNEYLARRDAEWMGRAYAALGVTCGLVFPGQLPARRRAAYSADVTYATYSELGFDYLRDNMKKAVEDLVQRTAGFAIVDEADSVLIDEAGTPLIISGPSQDKTALYIKIDDIVSRLLPEHFDHDKENSSVALTEKGYEFVESELRSAGILGQSENLYVSENEGLMLHVMQALRARQLYHRDQHYIVRDQGVILIQASTGRMMPTRRLSAGLHQAIEAKERVPIKKETVTLASTTVQNYFRLYPKLAGMTGTAATDAQELHAVYNLDVVTLPTNRKIVRKDKVGLIFRTEAEKHAAVLEAIREAHGRGQPVLVGTTSVEKSHRLSTLLLNEGIRHNILNAHHHERESEIIADAGRLGAVTIATNMAGRGTDIQLGGNANTKLEQATKPGSETSPEERERLLADHAVEKEAVIAAGGLLVIGTELHHSRRLDNQLRGRSGRQGDPGRTTFILSLEDDIVKGLDADWLRTTLSSKKTEERILLAKVADRAQLQAESRLSQLRMQLLKFDNVVNEQRKIIYGLRREWMQAGDLSDIVRNLRDEYIEDLISTHLPAGHFAEMWDTEGLADSCRRSLNLDLPIGAWAKEEPIDAVEIAARIVRAANAAMEQKVEALGADLMRNIEKQTLLETIDTKWADHRILLDQTRTVVGLRAYGRRDPMSEYQVEAVEQFGKLLAEIRQAVSSALAKIEAMTADQQLSVMSSLAMQSRSPG